MPVPDRCAGKEPRATVLSAAYAPEGICDDWRYRDTVSIYRAAAARFMVRKSDACAGSRFAGFPTSPDRF